MLKKYQMLLFILLFIVNCASSKNFITNNSTLKGQKIPGMIVEDYSGNKLSTFVFREKEVAEIIVITNFNKINSAKSKIEFNWVLIDTRIRKWYYPLFLYKRKFANYPKAIIDDHSGFLDKLKLAPGNYRIKINRGVIESISAL